MATYSSRHAKLWVRSPAPHPIRLVRRLFAACLAVLVLSVPVNAETYTAAGQKFVGNGSTFSSIGGYATSSMTFAGTGGIMLYNAFSNLDRQIETVRAASVTSTSLDTVFSKYFGSSGIFNSYFGAKISDILNTRFEQFFGPTGTLGNIYSKLGDVLTHTADTKNRLIYNGTSAAGWLYAIHQALGTANNNLTNINGSIGVTNDRIGKSAYFYYGPENAMLSKGSLLDAMSATNWLIWGLLVGKNQNNYLGERGSRLSGRPSILELTRSGFLGLSANLAGQDKVASVSLLTPSLDGGLVSTDVDADNLLDLLALATTQLQNPLAKLQYVLADDDDIRLKDKVKDNQQAVEDGFTGDGPGAIDKDDIGGVADISGGLNDVFGGSGSPGDAFGVLGDGDTWLFFSADVASELDHATHDGGESRSADVDDDPFAGFELGDDGLYHLAPGSMFDPSAYLEGLQ